MLGAFTLAFHPPGTYAVAQIGASDFVFFALFAAASVRMGLRVRPTWIATTASLGATMALSYVLDTALPALPLLSLAFLAANADVLLEPHPGEARLTRTGERSRGRELPIPWHAAPAAPNRSLPCAHVAPLTASAAAPAQRRRPQTVADTQPAWATRPTSPARRQPRPMAFSVWLGWRDPAGLDATLAGLYDPARPRTSAG